MLLPYKVEITGLQWIGPLLAQINLKLTKLMANQAELDAAIAALTTDIATQTGIINTAVQTIIDKIAAGQTPADFQTEVDQLKAAQAALDAVAGQLPQTPTP